VLHELRVENLLLMERAELRLAPGLNILTGETGAGKTLLAHALDLLLGGKARSGIVRDGAAEAYVEGVFSLPEDLDAELAERIPHDAEELVLARRVWPDGRTRAYVCGRSATLSDLRDLGSCLLAFYGQHEHRKLTLAAAQLDVLDAHCGIEQLNLRSQVAGSYERVRALEARMRDLEDLAGARDRELDLVSFELNEIEAVAPTAEEEAELEAERDRLRHMETLRSAAFAAVEAIAPDTGDGATELVAGASRQLEGAAAIDGSLGGIAERLEAARFEVEDIGHELRSYLAELEREPDRLEEVEERLALYARLERKHGGSVDDVLAHAQRCRERLTELRNAEVTLGRCEQERSEARGELERLARQLSTNRREAAPVLAGAVRERLAELAMPEARFDVDMHERPGGCGPRGVDVAEFRIAPNAGLPAGQIKEIASGGELSRVMLALLSVAHAQRADGEQSQPLLVFDEVDAGIGGHTARAVGEHLRALAAGRQILCITHLPQVAALGELHFTIEKDASVVPARTTVRSLEGDQVVGELVRMLGAGEGDRAASRHARELLRAA